MVVGSLQAHLLRPRPICCMFAWLRLAPGWNYALLLAGLLACSPRQNQVAKRHRVALSLVGCAHSTVRVLVRVQVLQRRCYWLLHSTEEGDIVLVHYLHTAARQQAGRSSSSRLGEDIPYTVTSESTDERPARTIVTRASRQKRPGKAVSVAALRDVRDHPGLPDLLNQADGASCTHFGLCQPILLEAAASVCCDVAPHPPADSSFISTEAGLLELPPGAGKPPRPARVNFERRPHDSAFAPPGDEPPVDPLMPLMPSMSLDSFLTVLDTRCAFMHCSLGR